MPDGNGEPKQTESPKRKRDWVPALTFVTLVLAGFTGWMAWETRNLAQLELKPFVTPYDVNLQMVNDKEGPKKEVTYLGGAVPVGTVKNINRYILTIKFSNPSKLPSMLRAKKIVGNFGPAGWNDHIFLVPAQGTTGWLYGVIFLTSDLAKFPSTTPIHIDYDFENFSPEMNITKSLRFSAECTFPNTNCFLLPFGAKLPLDLK